MSFLKVGSRAVLAGSSVVVLLLVWANWPASPLPKGTRADRLVVIKSQRTLTVWKHNKVLVVYLVSLGGQPVGAKSIEGDQRTPEGVYPLRQHRDHRASRRGCLSPFRIKETLSVS
ncbi:L,D-transpeptidase family protein [Verrucomicrobium spinosum]|uniref:L,D-transpeptidase family protein n=1 Tax=Verrucomicrobium spinosum TaxID=2736 RepID=UPI0006A72CFB